MKPNSTCRNCGSTELYSKEVCAQGYMELLPIGLFSRGKFLLRVCGGCGMVEWFVPDKYMAKVKKKFNRDYI